jgi:Uncharacterized protein conserved in bacteria
MKTKNHFSSSVIANLIASKRMGIRAGVEHRFVGIWVVVVNDRAFVRPWNNKATGWYRTFMKDPLGAIEISGREIYVRAKKTRGERLMDAIDSAYAEKYNTPANKKWVRGLILPRRRKTTLELIPIQR